MDWYYADSSQRQHRVDAGRLAELVAEGVVTQSTLVWTETLSDWTPCAAALPELFPHALAPGALPGQPPALIPAELGRARAASASGSLLSAPNAPSTELDPWALTSLILGAVGLFCCQLLAIPAIIFGHIGLKAANEGRCGSGSKGVAIAGLVTGYLSLLFFVAMLFYYVFVVVAALSESAP